MKTLDEIHDMIATAQAGDDDRLPDICQALLEHLRLAAAATKAMGNSEASLTNNLNFTKGDSR